MIPEPEDEWDWYEEDLEGLDLEEQLEALLQPVPAETRLRSLASRSESPVVPGGVFPSGGGKEPKQ